MFVFNDNEIIFQNEMSIKFDMYVQLFDTEFTEKYMDIIYHGMFIKFKMHLESNMTLLVDWDTIEMDSAEVVANVPMESDKLDDEEVVGYFNFVFQEVIPWVNEYHPESVTKFFIPSSFPGYVNINDLKMEVRNNYLAFSMNPEFLF